MALAGWFNGRLGRLRVLRMQDVANQGPLRVAVRVVLLMGTGRLGASPAATRLRLSATQQAANSLCRQRRKRRRTPRLRRSHPWRGGEQLQRCNCSQGSGDGRIG